MSSEQTRCGYVAIVGKPNVGKSTLLNRLVGQKISITARKPQTTRHQILGINSLEHTQIIYVDTPGMHKRRDGALNRYMNRVVEQVIADVDVVVFVLNRFTWDEEDDKVFRSIQTAKVPVILAINQVDRVKNKDTLLPHLATLQQRITAEAWLPISAKTGINIEALEQEISQRLPLAPYLFPPDQVTNRSQRFIVAEIVREKLFRLTGDELPYGLTVEIEQFETKNEILHIAALIWVDKPQHKAMIIGAKGDKLKQVGTSARLDMEKMLEQKVFLQLWVKVKSGWADDERVLLSLGYD